MPAFYLLYFIGLVAIWFTAYKLYRPIGKLILKIFNGSMNELKEKEKEEKLNKGEKDE